MLKDAGLQIQPERSMETTLVGRGQTVIISRHLPTVIIGERINPTGKQRLAEALRVGDLSVVCSEAIHRIKAITQAGLRDRVKIMVGGAPVTARFAEEIGADGYAPDAGAAVDKARELINT